MLKTFSEGISTGSNYESFAGEVKKVIAPKIKRPAAINNAVKYLRAVLKGEASPEHVKDIKKVIYDYRKKVWTSKEFLEKHGQKIRADEGKFFNKVYATKYPSVKLVTTVEKITKSGKTKEKIAAEILKTVKAGNKSLARYMTKAKVVQLLPGVIKLLGLGLIGVALYKRVMGEISKEVKDEFGEYYHPSVGWY